VASGAHGSGRYRYGGIRDFLIGARIVDGEGRLVRSGGKVVKNAAGFLLHQATIGSCGRFGVLAELTFKVFPVPPARASVRAAASDLGAALAALTAVLRARVDVEAIDIDDTRALWVRIAGYREGLPARVAAVQSAIGVASDVLDGEHESSAWRAVRELAWAPRDAAVVRVPLTLPLVPRLDRLLDATRRRYALAGNVAFIAWRGDLEPLSQHLAALGMTGQVLTGHSGRPFIGAIAANEFERRVRSVMDPAGRFAAA
jgi:glycolate oxidase FAD binding subunit